MTAVSSTTNTSADTPAATSGRTVPVNALILLITGTGLLVVAAAALPHLSDWADKYGTIMVFLGFFLIMSLAGRWFWAGIDAIIAAIKSRS